MNKKSIMTKVTVAVSSITLTMLSFCSKLEYQDGHSDIRRCSDMLYEVTYSDYTTVVPNGRYADMAGDMGCSSVRNGDFVGRNFDYFMNQCPTFVIHTTAKKGRYATVGVGRLAGINEASIKEGLPKDKMDFLPWALLDGMNEKGLVVNTNVLSREDWGKPHIGTKAGLPELNVLFTPRALLDNCADVVEALKYLDEHNITPLQSEKMNLQIMISDTKETYVVEFIDNTIVARRQNIMTNYHLFYEKIPDNALGVERYKVLEENYPMGGESMQSMWELMKKARYTNLYDYPTHIWYSELSSSSTYPYSKLEENKALIEAELKGIAAIWEVEKEYVEKNGLRETTLFWDTVHNSIYDIRNKKLWVTVHEWDNQRKAFDL